MLVMKFGGTSVGSAERIRGIVELVRKRLQDRPVVVVSALSKVTDALLHAAHAAADGRTDTRDIRARHAAVIAALGLPEDLVDEELAELRALLTGIAAAGNVAPRDLDHAGSFGERMSSKIVAACAKNAGISAKAYCAYDVGFLTDARFGNAEVLAATYPAVRRALYALPQDEVPVITGFLAKDASGAITTLGRGGSDYTATIIGAAINASAVEIWTDVNGVMTADPRLVSDARSVRELSFVEASELAHFGAKVLHPRTIRPAMQKGLPVRVLNTLHPEAEGTTIVPGVSGAVDMTSIVCRTGVSVITLRSEKMLDAYGFLQHVFRVFGEEKVPVDMISTSEVTVSLTVDGTVDIAGLLHKLSSLADVSVEAEKASIFIVGRDFKRRVGVCMRIFTALAEAGVNVEMISMGASEVNLGVVVARHDAERAVQALHTYLFPISRGVEV